MTGEDFYDFYHATDDDALFFPFFFLKILFTEALHEPCYNVDCLLSLMGEDCKIRHRN